MRVLVEGSGGSAGWPQPGCRCASCLRCQSDGSIRVRSIIVIDGGVFANSFLRGRRAWPFLERDGQFWGPPADDATAIAEFERMRAGGADFVAVAWPAFWWLDYYTQFATHLRDRFDVMLENDRLVVFDLRTAARPLSSTANEYARSEP